MNRMKRCTGILPLLCILILFAEPLLPVRAETVSCGDVCADPDAEYIDMGTSAVEDWDSFCAFLSAFPHLRAVDMYATELTRERIEDLHARFPQIRFGMTMRIRDHTLRTDATAFSTLHTPDSATHGTKDLSLVRYCTNLYALDLGHNDLTDLDFLYDLPELRVLIVAMNRLTDITPIGSLKHLEYLEIFSNQVTDVSCLGGLPYLTDLNLTGNRVRDLTPLTRGGSLKRLWMRACDLRFSTEETHAAAEAVRTALPGCTVDEKHFSIDGDWRRHPHYEVIRRIFATGIYEPFADSPPENRPDQTQDRQ
ncbi:MAG: leucine-rich repeat domain-containing protein [Clostridia bacterium]|nr:leucine-rich repeat domain-containing protein [Clostridia bacterium]